MKNNKVIMSLVLASISAMAAAPAFINSQKEGDVAKKDTKEDESKSIINLDSDTVSQMDESLKDEFNKQIDAMLLKKSSIQQLSESVSILVDNYGHEDQSLRDEIYEELNFAQSSDSVGGGIITWQGQGGGPNSNQVTYCHSACHSACHGACHGSRGWR